MPNLTQQLIGECNFDSKTDNRQDRPIEAEETAKHTQARVDYLKQQKQQRRQEHKTRHTTSSAAAAAAAASTAAHLTCWFCPAEYFASEDELIRHKTTSAEHRARKQLSRCSVCDLLLQSPAHLVQHCDTTEHHAQVTQRFGPDAARAAGGTALAMTYRRIECSVCEKTVCESAAEYALHCQAEKSTPAPAPHRFKLIDLHSADKRQAALEFDQTVFAQVENTARALIQTQRQLFVEQHRANASALQQQYQNPILAPRNLDDRFKCRACRIECGSFDELQLHYATPLHVKVFQKYANTGFVCSTCQQWFTSSELATRHESCHFHRLTLKRIDALAASKSEQQQQQQQQEIQQPVIEQHQRESQPQRPQQSTRVQAKRVPRSHQVTPAEQRAQEQRESESLSRAFLAFVSTRGAAKS